MKKLLIIALLLWGCDISTEPDEIHPLIGTWRWCGYEMPDHSISYFESDVTWTFYQSGQMYEQGLETFNGSGVFNTREWIWTTNENNELDSLIQTKLNGNDWADKKFHIDHYEIIDDSLKITISVLSIYCKE